MGTILAPVNVELELLTLPEAARELGLSHVQVWRYVHADRLPVVRIGSGKRSMFGVRREAVEELRAKRRKPGRPPRTPAP